MYSLASLNIQQDIHPYISNSLRVVRHWADFHQLTSAIYIRLSWYIQKQPQSISLEQQTCISCSRAVNSGIQAAGEAISNVAHVVIGKEVLHQQVEGEVFHIHSQLTDQYQGHDPTYHKYSRKCKSLMTFGKQRSRNIW